ncbi:hypothetical protein D3C76_1553460 [compost metagenome]
MVLVEVPALLGSSPCPGRFILGQLGKPLAGHDEIAGVSHPGEYLGKLDPEIHGQGDFASGLDRGGKLDFHQGLVVLVAVIRLHKAGPVH